MTKSTHSQRKQDIELLKKFKQDVSSWSETGSYQTRSEINRMMPRVRKILNNTCANKYISLNAPAMAGGQRLFENINALDLIFECPYNIDVSPHVIDACDMALGVLNDKEFEYTNEESQIQQTPNTTTGKRVFVVHGHDTALRTEVELLVKNLGFEPVVLFKQANKGATIIEKLERESNDVCFAIVLYTGCDEGKAIGDSDYKPRARQNVVFEHGMMCALLGRDHVVALVEEGVEIPGDISGVIYIPLSDGGWNFSVAKEMKAVGLEVDLNKLIM